MGALSHRARPTATAAARVPAELNQRLELFEAVLTARGLAPLTEDERDGTPRKKLKLIP